MAKKFERVFREQSITDAEAANDESVRRQVAQEFPGASNSKPHDLNSQNVRMSFANQLRRSIRDSGKSLSVLSQETGLPETLFAQFLAGERDIRIATAEKLADALGLTLTAS